MEDLYLSHVWLGLNVLKMTHLVNNILILFGICIIINATGNSHGQMSVKATLDSDEASSNINEAVDQLDAFLLWFVTVI